MSGTAIAKQTKPILQKFGVEKAAIFGSYARGDFKKTSDVDVLVKLKREATLFDIVRLKIRLENRLRRKVDIVEYDSIKPEIRQYALRNQIPVL